MTSHECVIDQSMISIFDTKKMLGGETKQCRFNTWASWAVAWGSRAGNITGSVVCR